MIWQQTDFFISFKSFGKSYLQSRFWFDLTMFKSKTDLSVNTIKIILLIILQAPNTSMVDSNSDDLNYLTHILQTYNFNLYWTCLLLTHLLQTYHFNLYDRFLFFLCIINCVCLNDVLLTYVPSKMILILNLLAINWPDFWGHRGGCPDRRALRGGTGVAFCGWGGGGCAGGCLGKE